MQRNFYVVVPTNAVEPQSRKIRRAAYFRVSSKSLIQEESFIFQKREWESILGSMPNTEVVGFYSDTMSGYHDTKRDGFQRLIRDALDGKIDVIHCKAISRFCRGVPLLIETLRKLADKGVSVVFDQENINSLDVKQSLMLQLQGIIAENDIKNNKFLVEQSRKRGYEKGKPYICVMPYGYRQEYRPDFVPHEEQAPHVRTMFEMFAKGSGYKAIAARLNALGARTRDGRPWLPGSIRTILKNEKFVGDFHCQKNYTDENHVARTNYGEVKSWYIENNHQGLISRELWNICQEKLKANEYGRRDRPNDTSGQNKGFTKKVVCSNCDKNYRVHRDYTGNKLRRYWVCNTKAIHGCPTVSDQILKDLALSAYQEYSTQDHIQKGKLEIRLQEILKDQTNLTALKDGKYINQESYSKELARITAEFQRVDNAMRKSHDKNVQEFTAYHDDLCDHIDKVFVHGDQLTFLFVNGQEIKRTKGVE